MSPSVLLSPNVCSCLIVVRLMVVNEENEKKIFNTMKKIQRNLFIIILKTSIFQWYIFFNTEYSIDYF